MARMEEHHIDDIINYFYDDLNIKAIKELMGFNNSEWDAGLKEFSALRFRLQEARIVRSDERVQTMFEVSKDQSIDVSRAKLIIDTIKWEASKLIPAVYGDKLAIEVKTIDIREGLARAEDAAIENKVQRILLERTIEDDSI